MIYPHTYLGIAASVIGLLVSVYIYRKKHQKAKLFCPLRTQCDEVVTSSHATTLGIPNEVLGIIYYTLTGTVCAASLVIPIFSNVYIHALLIFAVLCGVLFSVYLIALQGFVIRAWCVWCLMSAVANVLLIISLFGIPGDALFVWLSQTKLWWVILHNIGFVLGLGGATITDVFFFRFLKDNQISESEKDTMDTLSGVIWVGLGILVVSGIMLYLPDQERLNDSAKFLLKVVVVSVVIVNGMLLNLLVAPKLRSLSFENTPPARSFRKIAFALGGISIVSWYLAFLLGSMRKIDPTLNQALIGYGVILMCVVIGSQIYEKIVSKK